MTLEAKDSNSNRWNSYQSRYRNGDYRANIFRDMILSDIFQKNSEQKDRVTVVDIGCGGGFDGDSRIQQQIAEKVGLYIGIEPDEEIDLLPIFSKTYRHTLENSPIEPESVDIAFAVMVLEHIENPILFWRRIHSMLRPGGVFWGFTIDARHWFVNASLAFDKLRVKDAYLNVLHGKRGEERYENYGVFYKMNHPDVVMTQTVNFARSETVSFQRVGQLDYYFPTGIKWVSRAIDRVGSWQGKPGNVMAIRVER